LEAVLIMMKQGEKGVGGAEQVLKSMKDHFQAIGAKG
jgi:hypothetical protein